MTVTPPAKSSKQINGSITIPTQGEFMAILKGLASIVSELKVERMNMAKQLRHLDAALTVLGKMNGGTSYTRPGRGLAASARMRISLAQKKRWAKARKGSSAAAGVAVATASAPVKRIMSASARRKIAAAQRKRWAKVKAAKKKAT
jgi:hypothetical protein